MQLTSVLLARVYALFQTEDLNPKGTVFYPDVVKLLVERYEFNKYPTKEEELDESKGIEFHTGRSGTTVIEKVVILNSGIYVDTLASTDASEEILLDAMAWATKEFGLMFKPEMLKRRAYISNITFHSDAPLLDFHPTFAKVCNIMTKEVTENFGQNLKYMPSGIAMTFDPRSTNFGTSPFTLLRREGAPWDEKKYFSASPLRTKIHISLIEEMEKDLSRK